MSQPIEILLVEDNPGDVELLRINMRRLKMLNNLAVCTDGEEGLAYLKQEAPFANVTLPDLILLDLNLPKLDGKSLLKEIKADPKLQMIPVVVLTSSDAESDILRSYQLHANCYVKKPVDLGEMREIVKSIEHFWFSIVRLPPK